MKKIGVHGDWVVQRIVDRWLLIVSGDSPQIITYDACAHHLSIERFPNGSVQGKADDRNGCATGLHWSLSLWHSISDVNSLFQEAKPKHSVFEMSIKICAVGLIKTAIKIHCHAHFNMWRQVSGRLAVSAKSRKSSRYQNCWCWPNRNFLWSDKPSRTASGLF